MLSHTAELFFDSPRNNTGLQRDLIYCYFWIIGYGFKDNCGRFASENDLFSIILHKWNV